MPLLVSLSLLLYKDAVIPVPDAKSCLFISLTIPVLSYVPAARLSLTFLVPAPSLYVKTNSALSGPIIIVFSSSLDDVACAAVLVVYSSFRNELFPVEISNPVSSALFSLPDPSLSLDVNVRAPLLRLTLTPPYCVPSLLSSCFCIADASPSAE